MKISPHVAAPATDNWTKSNVHNEMNPAKQAKAAEPAVRGAEFGHLVASFAHAKHAPAPSVLSPPVPVEEAAEASDPLPETPPTGPVDETPPVEAVEETPPAEAQAPPPAADPTDAIETQLLANLVADSEPGDLFDIVA